MILKMFSKNNNTFPFCIWELGASRYCKIRRPLLCRVPQAVVMENQSSYLLSLILLSPTTDHQSLPITDCYWAIGS